MELELKQIVLFRYFVIEFSKRGERLRVLKSCKGSVCYVCIHLKKILKILGAQKLCAGGFALQVKPQLGTPEHMGALGPHGSASVSLSSSASCMAADDSNAQRPLKEMKIKQTYI